MDRLSIPMPDDWHVHVRDGAMMQAVVPYTARQFARAIIMPNLVPPVTTVAAAIAYRDRILAAVPPGVSFQPLMTCYLTDGIDPDEVARGFEAGVWVAAKLYPAHATTNSAHGVSAIQAIQPVLERMATIGMPLLVHGEVTDRHVDIFDREAVFIQRVLRPLTEALPTLRIVLEHITTAEAVAFVEQSGPTIAATITAHHLIINRNALFEGGIRPHLYCLPVAKRETHRLELRRAAVSGNPKFFLGTDSAPHPTHAKEAACGCAGIFSAPAAMEAYAQVFDEEAKLPRLEGFASRFGPAFYRLPVNDRTLTLERGPTDIAERIEAGGAFIVPFGAGTGFAWRVLNG
ncbi:MAG: dihydroorotase [Alphaproteobacteria bacterium]|nr:dihydroorotase [Alphaproteobacteria bacterium]TAD88084.1 MAG: dihydroorotase [Alphaproteobacteria bacterium]